MTSSVGVHLKARLVLAKVLTVFAREGIDVLPVKGIVTAYELYGHFSERPIGDIDMLFMPSDQERISRVVLAEMWDLRVDKRAAQELEFNVDGLTIDMKGSVGPRGICAISVREILARANRVERVGVSSYLRAELHDQALVSCLNVLRDNFVRAPAWALDDVERFARHSEFQVERMLAVASEARLVGALWVVADWMAKHRLSNAWRAVRDRIGPCPRPLYAYLVFAVRHDTWPRVTQCVWQLAPDRLSDQWTCIANFIFSKPMQVLLLGAWLRSRRREARLLRQRDAGTSRNSAKNVESPHFESSSI